MRTEGFSFNLGGLGGGGVLARRPEMIDATFVTRVSHKSIIARVVCLSYQGLGTRVRVLHLVSKMFSCLLGL